MRSEKRVIALGFFDGVHIGHGALLRLAKMRAEQYSAIPSATTFDVQPKAMTSGKGAPLLTMPAERAELMRRLYEIQDILVIPFNDHTMHLGWQEFVTNILINQYGAVHLIVGENFHFGYRGEGNPARLQQLCKTLGLGCDVVPSVKCEEHTISSTRIRALIASGEVSHAARLLGHPFCLTDQVRHGKKLGSKLGFPTLNLPLPVARLSPAFGVYATQVWVEGTAYAAATNVGIRPTVEDGHAVTVEGTLLDFNGDLYGKSVRMDFYEFLRPEKKFETLTALRTQVMKDIESVRNYFHNSPISERIGISCCP